MLWFEVVEDVQRLGKARRIITSATLSERAGIGLHAASAWLGKMVRWGYVARDGTVSGDRHWVRVYTLTDYGKRWKYAPKKIVHERTR